MSSDERQKGTGFREQRHGEELGVEKEEIVIKIYPMNVRVYDS